MWRVLRYLRLYKLVGDPLRHSMGCSSKSIKRGFLGHFLCPEDLLLLGCFTAHKTNQARENGMKRIRQTIQDIQKKKKGTCFDLNRVERMPK